MQTVLRDVRYALRMMRKRPAFTAVALVTLAVGIGANTAIFSVVQAVLLQPLPFGQPEELVQVWESRVDRGWNRSSFTHANFWDFKELNRTCEGMAAYLGTNVNLLGDGYPEQLSAGRVSAGFFHILRVSPILGRSFLPGEDEPEAENRLVLLSEDFWRRRFGADRTVLGRSLALDGESYTVVGVIPAGEPWLNFADVFVPFVHDPEANRVSFELAVIARLKPGVGLEAVRSDLESVARRLEELYPEENAGIGVSLAPASSWLVDDDLRRAMWVLFGAVGVLLLIACVNLANLLTASTTARQRELAVRSALGASRGRIVRQMLTESLLLGLIGAGLGLVVALGVVSLVRAFDPGGIPRLAQVTLDTSMLAFTAAVGLFAGLLSGLIPALQAPARAVTPALRDGDRSTAGSRTRKRLRDALIACEVALSLVLLVGAGLLVRSFQELLDVDRGFQSDRRLVAAVNLPGSYQRAQIQDFLQRFLARVEAVPQVHSIAGVNMRPIVGGNTGLGIVPAGRPDPEDGVPWAGWRLITKDYFRTMGLPLIRGRVFSEQDRIGEPWRAIVSQRLAERLWPGEDPIGRQAILWRGQDEIPAEIIGVVGDMRERGLDTEPTLAVYLPYYGAGWVPIHFVIHTAGEPTAVVPTLRSLLAELDPALPLSDVRSLDDIVSASVAERRFNMLLLAVFAGVALVLAVVGIYGVQAYSVTRRTAEIGVRVALGASARAILRLIVGQGMRPALWGIAVGLLGAFGLSRLLTSLLFGIVPSDPATYAGVAVVLAAAALASCYLPARRALSIDPAVALRDE